MDPIRLASWGIYYAVGSTRLNQRLECRNTAPRLRLQDWFIWVKYKAKILSIAKV